MKSKRKALTLALCAVLLVVTSVLGTMAYLTDTDAVTNTFTIGKVYINLTETEADEMGNIIGERRDVGNDYKLLPGHTYTKDPMVTVEAGSEDCYVRMIVTVEGYDKLTAAIDDSGYYYEGKFLLQKLCMDGFGADAECTWDGAEWECVSIRTSADGEKCDYEFRYIGPKSTDGVIPKSAAKTELEELFTKITVPTHLGNDEIAALAEVDINVVAHAIQADGFTSADAAWNAFDGE